MAGSGEHGARTSSVAYSQQVGRFAPVQTSTFPPRTTSTQAIPTRRAQSTEDFVLRTGRALNREQQRQQSNGMSTQTVVQEVRPSAQQQPRRMSNASHVSAASTAVSSGEATDYSTRVRSSSWSSHSSQSSSTTVMSQASAASAASATTDPKQADSPQTQAQSQWKRPALIKTSRRRAAAGEIFAALPGEVLELILDELKEVHLARGSDSCATCWMRDACSMALTARKMLKYARAALYEDVQLVGVDSAAHRKKLKPLQHGTRLVLLRRTLRSSPQIAAIVRSLKVPGLPKGASLDEYQNLVASVVMACPNLERIVGFYPTYDHATFRRFFHALSTRRRLKEMSWIIEPTPTKEAQQQQQQIRPRSRGGAPRSLAQLVQQTPPPSPGPLTPVSSQFASQFASQFSSPFRVPAPPPLEPQHSAKFFDMHVSWQYLTSLTVHCKTGATLAPDTLLIEALTCLPALQNLYLSHLPHTSFSDATLLGLPPLKKLSLVHVEGVSSAGLSTFASRNSSQALEALSLVHVNLDSLQALARILSKLTLLSSFTMVQMYPPTLTPGEVIWLFPYLASASLRRLHWDVPTYANRANAADIALARSIAADGFPSLRTLRAPADPEGIFQALCRPQLRAELPDDRFQIGEQQAPLPSPRVRHGRSDSTSSASSLFSKAFRGGGSSGSMSSSTGDSSHSRSGSSTSYSLGSMATPTSPAFAPPECLLPQLYSDLLEARRMAQRRIESAKQAPRFIVNVRNDSGALVENHAVGAFIGTVHSRIQYHLVADVGGTDEKGGLLDMDNLLEDNSEATGTGSISVKGVMDQAAVPDGCTGRWNANWEVSQKKDKERWWHTERGRWKAVVLS